jgi:hypothetical protein
VLGHPNLVPTTGFAAPMFALIHLSERWSIFGISTLRYSRGHLELVHHTDQLCTLLDKTLHCESQSAVVLRVTVDLIVDDWKVDGSMFETLLIRCNKTRFNSVVNIQKYQRLPYYPKVIRVCSTPGLRMNLSGQNFSDAPAQCVVEDGSVLRNVYSRHLPAVHNKPS